MINHRLANAVRSRLLTPGGILASEYETGEQWDKPNGWAPLQWMAIQGFKMYGDDLLGDEIARNWLKTVNQFYLNSKTDRESILPMVFLAKAAVASIRCRMEFIGLTVRYAV